MYNGMYPTFHGGFYVDCSLLSELMTWCRVSLTHPPHTHHRHNHHLIRGTDNIRPWDMWALPTTYGMRGHGRAIDPVKYAFLRQHYPFEIAGHSETYLPSRVVDMLRFCFHDDMDDVNRGNFRTSFLEMVRRANACIEHEAEWRVVNGEFCV